MQYSFFWLHLLRLKEVGWLYAMGAYNNNETKHGRYFTGCYFILLYFKPLICHLRKGIYTLHGLNTSFLDCTYFVTLSFFVILHKKYAKLVKIGTSYTQKNDSFEQKW